MNQDDFVEKICVIIRDHSRRWLPEESTEEEYFNILNRRLNEHKKDIVEAIK